ncbi:TPA: hypothetical protein ACX6SR_002980 [Photobacterium damselae]
MNKNSIEMLELNKTWKRRFNLFEYLQADILNLDEILKSNKYKTLHRKDKVILKFNFFAFIGGFLYYYAKGMYYKGTIMLSASILWAALLTLIEFVGNITLPNTLYWMIPGYICSTFSNFDYYRKMLYGEVMWKSWPREFHYRKGCIASFLLSATIYTCTIGFISNHEFTTGSAMISNDVIKISCGIDKLYVLPSEIDLLGQKALCNEIKRIRFE